MARGRPRFEAMGCLALFTSLCKAFALYYIRFWCFDAKYTEGFLIGRLPLIIEFLIFVIEVVIVLNLKKFRTWLREVQISSWTTLLVRGMIIMAEFFAPELLRALIDRTKPEVLLIYVPLVIWAYFWRMALDKVMPLRLAAFFLKDGIGLAYELLGLDPAMEAVIAYVCLIVIMLYDMWLRGLMTRRFRFEVAIRFNYTM